MVSLSFIDIFIIAAFFIIVVFLGFLPKKIKKNEHEDFLLSGRKVGLLVFVLTTVSSWYGGILGVGEFSYKYGLLSWTTQGFPYYVFAFLFALFFSEKVRKASLITVPEKFELVYGRKVSLISTVLVFFLVSPAPYMLMIGYLISVIFNISIIWGLIITGIASSAYLIKGGFKSDLYTNSFQFFVMFGGFILIVLMAYFTFGGMPYLEQHLPSAHLKFSGNMPPLYLIVWFLIALWTFTDPGFHQRTNAAKNGKTAKWGILISILLFALFDFLTTSTGLYARAAMPDLANPVLSFPALAEKILGPGLKGLFYAAMFATILATLNSFVFLSSTTIGYDIIFKLKKIKDKTKIIYYTRIGTVITTIIAIILAYFFNSVIEIWFTVGSICIPGLILLVIGAYYKKFEIPGKWAFCEVLFSTLSALSWFILRSNVASPIFSDIEPMIVGLVVAVILHLIAMYNSRIKTN